MDQDLKYLLEKETKTQRVWVTDFTEESAIQFNEAILQRFQENPAKPIIIDISSYGGSIDALFSMIDGMDAIKAVAPQGFFFATVASGPAMSAGAYLLSYGDFRFSQPNSRIMLHQAHGGALGGMPQAEVDWKEFERINERILSIISKRAKVKGGTKALKRVLGQDKYLTPEEARDLGIIDVVGYPVIREHKVYELGVANATPVKRLKVKNKDKKDGEIDDVD